MAARRCSPTTWLSLIAVYVGCVLHPLEMPADFGQYIWGSALVPVWPTLAQVTRILAGAMLLLFVIVAVTSWRMRNDEKAKAFLEHTRLVAGPTDGIR